MTDASSPPADRRLLALGLRLLSTIGFGCMAVLVKLAGDKGVKLPEILFWRQAFAVPVAVIWVILGPGFASLATTRLSSHGKRAAFGLTAMLLNFGALQLLPLAEATSISFAVPLFATAIAALFMAERVGWRRWLAVAAGFAGVLVVVQPGGNALPLGGSLMALAGAMVVAMVSFQIRDLTRTEPSTTIVFWFSALSLLPLALALPWCMTAHTPAVWLILFGIGTLGGLAQVVMTQSLRFGPVSSVIVMDYFGIIWAVGFGWLIWDHLPPASTWIGAPLIVGSALFIAWREHRLAVERSRELGV